MDSGSNFEILSGDALHLAKLAYLKAEDALKRLDALGRAADGGGFKTVEARFENRVIFNGQLALAQIKLNLKSDAPVYVSARLHIDSEVSGENVLTVTPSLAGVSGAPESLPLEQGLTVSSVSFVLSAKKGFNPLLLSLSANAGLYSLERAVITVSAQGLSEEDAGLSMSAFKSQYGTMLEITGGGKTDIINQTSNSQTLSSVLLSLSSPIGGACATIKSGTYAYRLCHAAVSAGGTLTLSEYNLLTLEKAGEQSVETGVTSVSLGCCGGESSCVLSYVKSGKVYARLITYLGGFILSEASQLGFSGSPDAVKCLHSASGVSAVCARVGKIWYLKRFDSLSGNVPVYQVNNLKLTAGNSLNGSEEAGTFSIYIGSGGRVSLVQTDGSEISASPYAFCDELVREGALTFERVNDRIKVKLT